MTTAKLPAKKKIAWLVTIVIPAIILLLPTTQDFNRDIKIFFAITVAVILWFALELTNNFIPALLLPVAYTLSGITSAETAFAPWAQNTPWMVLAALLIVVIVERIGLLTRAAYFVLGKLANTYNGFLYALLIVGILFNLLFSGITYILLIPVVYGVCRALKMDGTRAGVGIMLAGMCAANMPSMIVYNPAMIGMAASIVNSSLGVSIGWLQCLLQNIILFPLCFLMVFIITKIYKPDVPFQGKEYFEEKRKSFGKMSLEEKKGLVLLGILLIGLITSGIHGIDVGWVTVLVTICFYLPGINLGSEKDIRKINFPIVVFMVSCMSIGQVSSELGVGQLIANVVTPLMASVSTPIFIFITWLLAVVLNLLMTPLAAIATFSLPIAQIACDFGINPVPVLYTFVQGLDQVFLPYEYLNYLFAFSFGLVSTKQFLQFFTIKTALNIVYIMLIAVPFWMLIGLL